MEALTNFSVRDLLHEHVRGGGGAFGAEAPSLLDAFNISELENLLYSLM